MFVIDYWIDGYLFFYLVVIDVVVYCVDDIEKFMVYDMGIFCKGIMFLINMIVGIVDICQFYFNVNFVWCRLWKCVCFDS